MPEVMLRQARHEVDPGKRLTLALVLSLSKKGGVGGRRSHLSGDFCTHLRASPRKPISLPIAVLSDKL